MKIYRTRTLNKIVTNARFRQVQIYVKIKALRSIKCVYEEILRIASCSVEDNLKNCRKNDKTTNKLHKITNKRKRKIN